MNRLRIALITPLFLTVPALAQEHRVQLSGAMGLSSVPTSVQTRSGGASSEEKAVGTGMGFGLLASVFAHPHFGVGGFLKSAGHDQGIHSNLRGLEAVVQGWGRLRPLQVAGGPVWGNFSALGWDGETARGLGFRVSYDFQLHPNYPVTLGAELGIQNLNVPNLSAGTETRYWFLTPAAALKVWL